MRKEATIANKALKATNERHTFIETGTKKSGIT
jgi:hypothetical protein